MSYRGSAYRGPGDRSRSPPRFGGDRRPSAANIFDNRHSGPPRNASDAPRGPRSQSQFDGPPARGPAPSGLSSAGAPRTLRDAPPLGTGDRARPPFREREYSDRRDRSPPPIRERSPPRRVNDSRDFPPRDLDVRSARRSSRDGPLSAGSTYSDNPPFSSSSTFRGGFTRGRGSRGGGDFFDRSSSRGGRRGVDDRADLFRRERSPPPRFGRDLSRDGRESDRRDERRFDRRDDERRPEWLEREREREVDRPLRRDQPPSRLETRASNDSIASASASYQSALAPPINPERLAIIESSGADPNVRRPSSAQAVPPPARRETASETPAHITARADSTAHRYGSRGSSPPTQAPPVPAFSFSLTATAAAPQPVQSTKPLLDSHTAPVAEAAPAQDLKPTDKDKTMPPANAPTAPRALPLAKNQHASPPPTAPRAPRALELDSTMPPSNRLQGVRSLDNMSGAHQPLRSEPPAMQSTTMPPSPNATRTPLPHLAQPFSPNPSALSRFDLAAPTGPKASRMSPALSGTSPRPPYTSPRTDAGAFQRAPSISQRGQTPPPLAPSGPRRSSFSVSPKVASTGAPTAPRAGRAPPVAPRTNEGIITALSRPLDRATGVPQVPPSGPRGHAGSVQWNQWKRPSAPMYGDRPGSTLLVKQGPQNDEKDPQDRVENKLPSGNGGATSGAGTKEEQDSQARPAPATDQFAAKDQMDIDPEPSRRKSTLTEGHSAAQSFFGKTVEKSEDDVISSSDEDELDEEEDATLLEAKHARQERELRARMHDLSQQRYRGTAPLESIARLFRLSDKDMERSVAQRDDDVDMDDLPAETGRHAPTAMQSSESDDGPDVPTPRGDDGSAVAIREPDDTLELIRRPRYQSPEPVPLPYLIKGQAIVPLHENEIFQENIKTFEEVEPEVIAELERVALDEDESEQYTKDVFDELYHLWRQECEDLDREREEQEKLERQQSAELGPEPDASAAIAANPILEGRRLHKYASEYALEQVLKQSEETARIEQERAEREARKNQADMEKEARLPDQQSQEEITRSALIDSNRLRDPTSLTLVFSYEPPPDDFSEDEQQVFIAAFKDTPKKWGEIASLLPGRTYKDCIQHYYANKWDGRFRDNRAKKFKGGRRGRGGKRGVSRGSALMADLNRNEDLVSTTDSSTGRPKRAAAPTTFGEKEIEAKGSLLGQSPAKRPLGAKDTNGETEKKRRKTEAKKPGKKPQPAHIAAAPIMSPNKAALPGLHAKEELLRAQTLEDASLLTNLQGGLQALSHADAQMMYSQEGFVAQRTLPDDADRPKPAAAQRPGASSYWSVPEQTDFFKYIAYFGTDFGAIASHMGTKTQTMIKNHYQRQIDGGRGDLEESAKEANARRQRGDNMGPPPTPTPIVKRRYDNPQSTVQRTIAPDPMDTDEATSSIQQPTSKHASPPQPPAQAKPLYQTSAHSTPIPSRVVPNPLGVTSAPMNIAPPTATHPRGIGHPLGPRYHRLDEARGDSRSGMQSSQGFRLPQDEVPASRIPQQQPPPQPSRTPSNAMGRVPDPQYLIDLREEQERAMRMQSDLRSEQYHAHGRHDPMHISHGRGSPASRPLSVPVTDRKPIMEERVPTPPRGSYFAPAPPRQSMFASTAQPLPPPSAPPLSSLTARGPYNPSPPKPDLSRPGSVPTSAPLQLTPSHTPAPMLGGSSAAPAPEPPKRSNLMSILNSEAEEPKPAPKRDSLPSTHAAPSRVSSPASHGYPPTSAPQGIAGAAPQRRDTFGQPSLSGSQGHFHRSSYGQGLSTGTPPSTLKHESSSGAPSQSQAPSNEWTSRVFNSGTQPSPSTNPISTDRDPSRYFTPGRGMLGSIGGPARAVASPPPHSLHSRTPSLTAQQALPAGRDQRSLMSGPPQSSGHAASQATHSIPYGSSQQLAPYSQAPSLAHNRSHHSHNSSITDGSGLLSRFGQPAPTREDMLRSEDERARHKHDGEEAYRRRFDALQAEKSSRDPRDHYLTQREHETERQRQQQQQHAFSRAPLPGQMQPPCSSPYESPFAAQPPSRASSAYGSSLREQSARESEYMMQQETRRVFEENERKRQQEQGQGAQQQIPPSFMRDARREDFYSRRTTPYGGPPYAAPQPGRR